MVREKVERGIDKFRVGQIVLLKFPSLLDENFYDSDNKDENEKNIKKDLENASILPAIITAKGKNFDEWPNYDVAFLTRGRNGEMSGFITITDMCVWRYLGGKNDKEETIEGNPPKFLLKGIKQAKENGEKFYLGILIEKICYIAKGSKEDGSEDYWVYPFKEN
jgi:hypothetical protein